jgi:glycosyltransferase involved in cell wall biosynthesis
MKKICFISTIPQAANFHLVNHFVRLSQKYEVSFVASTTDTQYLRKIGVDVEVLNGRIERDISPVKDLRALFCLFRLFRKNRFDAIHSLAPKAGFLSMLAGIIARIPVRIHIFTGQVWVTKTGFMRFFLKAMDKLTAFMATHNLGESFSQREFLLQNKIVSDSKSKVLAEGSVCGVDTSKFSPNPSERLKIRQGLNIPENSLVYIFLGRLKKDKGVLDLAQAFIKLPLSQNPAHLLIVGSDEEGLELKIKKICASYENRLRFVSLTQFPERYLASADVLCLPSYREGFGNVIIEGASTGIPSIASRIYGVIDAIDENETGLLYEAGNSDELAARMKMMLKDPELRKQLGENALSHSRQHFAKEKVTKAWFDYYQGILG